jgi:hypothetical protein
MIKIIRGAQDAISAEVAPSLTPTAKTHVAANGGPLAALPGEIDRHGYAMHYGNEICDRGPPRSDRRCFHWKVFRPEPALATG